MTQEKKERVGILMKPSQMREVDALYPLHGHASRSEFVCQAVDFYSGFLKAGSSEKYMNETTLAFLEDKLERLESRVCKQLFRMCVELELSAHLFASQAAGASDDLLEQLRKRCISDVKKTVGSIRFDNIYAFQHGQLEQEED